MYCINCGNPIKENVFFCASCGAAINALPPTAPSPSPITMQMTNRNTAGKAPKKKMMDYLMVPIAILLILMGTGYMALMLAGRTVTAQVTDCEQVLYVNNDTSTRNPSRYKLEYQFSINGERYTGSVTRVFSGGSHMRQTISVHYLPFWPHINTEERDVNPAGPVTLGTGILMLILSVKKKLRNKGHGDQQFL